MEQELPLQSEFGRKNNQEKNHRIMSHLWFRLLLIATAVKSILGLIILSSLLIVSIIVLSMGFYFRHSYHCPIAPDISLFLIVAGSASIEWIILSFYLSIITIFSKYIRSRRLVIFIILIAWMIIITNLFLIVWLVYGSIWTLKVFDTVQYTKPHMKTFCKQSLYQFTLGYLILTYILSALQCWYRLCIVIFCSIQQQQ